MAAGGWAFFGSPPPPTAVVFAAAEVVAAEDAIDGGLFSGDVVAGLFVGAAAADDDEACWDMDKEFNNRIINYSMTTIPKMFILRRIVVDIYVRSERWSMVAPLPRLFFNFCQNPYNTKRGRRIPPLSIIMEKGGRGVAEH